MASNSPNQSILDADTEPLIDVASTVSSNHSEQEVIDLTVSDEGRPDHLEQIFRRDVPAVLPNENVPNVGTKKPKPKKIAKRSQRRDGQKSKHDEIAKAEIAARRKGKKQDLVMRRAEQDLGGVAASRQPPSH